MSSSKSKKFRIDTAAGRPACYSNARKAAASDELAAASFFGLKIQKQSAKYKILSVPFKMAASDQALILNLPEVQRHLEWQERWMFIKAARVLMDNGLSLNRAAKTLGRPASWLSNLLAAERRGGAWAVFPKVQHRQDTTACQLTITLK